MGRSMRLAVLYKAAADQCSAARHSIRSAHRKTKGHACTRCALGACRPDPLNNRPGPYAWPLASTRCLCTATNACPAPAFCFWWPGRKPRIAKCHHAAGLCGAGGPAQRTADPWAVAWCSSDPNPAIGPASLAKFGLQQRSPRPTSLSLRMPGGPAACTGPCRIRHPLWPRGLQPHSRPCAVSARLS